MSHPRFLADHDLNEHIIEGVLRREPIVEFVRARDVDMHDRTDPELLGFAADNGFLIVSHDISTMPGHGYARVTAGKRMCGLLMAHQTKPIAPVIDDLVLIWSASEAEEWQDQVRFLPL